MQSDVSITTNEKNLKIEYGLIDFGKERELASSSVKYILTDLNDIRQNYIRLGFHLSEFIHMKYYEDFGYSNVADFAKNNLGMDKSAISRCVNVYRAFASRNSNGNFTMHLDDRYKEYSYSQLTEMLSLTEKQRSLVRPDMTVKEIRNLKNELLTSSSQPVVTSSAKVATSQQIETKKFSSFSDKLFISELLFQVKKFCFSVADSHNFSILGSSLSEKRFSFKDVTGTTYNITVSVSEKKES